MAKKNIRRTNSPIEGQVHQNPDPERAETEPAKEEIVRLNLDLPKSLRTAFKARVAIEGRTMSELVEGWIRQYLQR